MKRARGDSEEQTSLTNWIKAGLSTVVFVDGGEAFRPPGVYSVKWAETPFREAAVPKAHKQYWVAMTGQMDPDDYEPDEDDGEEDYEDEDGVRSWSITSMCKELGVEDAAAAVHEWLKQKKFASTGKALLHPKIAFTGLNMESVVTIFVSTDLEEYETQN